VRAPYLSLSLAPSLLAQSIFAAAQQKIKAHNAEGHSWSMGLNKFADLTAEEFKSLYASGYRAQEKRSKNVELSLLHAKANPASVDWSTKGAWPRWRPRPPRPRSSALTALSLLSLFSPRRAAPRLPPRLRPRTFFFPCAQAP
jgi:hypothetical protein